MQLRAGGGTAHVSAGPHDLGTSLQDAQLCVGQTIVSWESLVAGVPSCSIWSGRAQGELPAGLQQPEHQSRQQIAPARR